MLCGLRNRKPGGLGQAGPPPLCRGCQGPPGQSPLRGKGRGGQGASVLWASKVLLQEELGSRAMAGPGVLPTWPNWLPGQVSPGHSPHHWPPGQLPGCRRPRAGIGQGTGPREPPRAAAMETAAPSRDTLEPSTDPASARGPVVKQPRAITADGLGMEQMPLSSLGGLPGGRGQGTGLSWGRPQAEGHTGGEPSRSRSVGPARAWRVRLRADVADR